ncbi:hypothetical protein KIP88_02445 [Bradyrhizobium sp. SRL28]|uniref:hypothetical protein n=1 Tax=Bradyrhizobium sp. SRL28 TaxID=2836178 RepID=UPI001BDE99E2|nr:hypothetical protein [Bradyrhizobium sp. SRL28]MBT1509349.1 hypothetical protein [Bradyrhizobium sp. SRL28]
MTNDRLQLLAAWVRRERRERTDVNEVIEYANDIGITMDAHDAIDLFHYINNGEDQHERHYEPAS